MGDEFQRRGVWAIAAPAALCVCYVVCRHGFYALHGMKSWPLALAILGLVAIIVAANLGSRVGMVSPVVGYLGGFVLGMALRRDGVDPGGGATSNLWIIWGGVFAAAVVIGVVVERVLRRRRS